MVARDSHTNTVVTVVFQPFEARLVRVYYDGPRLWVVPTLGMQISARPLVTEVRLVCLMCSV